MSLKIALAKLLRRFGKHVTPSCTVCGRALSDPTSMETGMGPVCRHKAAKAAFDALTPDLFKTAAP